MNKILIIENNLTNYQDEFLTINNNTVNFLKTGAYILEYQNCTTTNLTINVSDNVQIKLLEYSNNNNFQNNNTYNINEYATLYLSKFYHNKGTTENLKLNLNQPYAKITYQFRTIATGTENYNIEVNHLAPNTTSDIYNKAITIENGIAIFNIDSRLPKGNHHSTLNQETRIINFNNNKCSINPNMYIEEDDVEARHGSVIGNFSYDNIFYLMTRGIPYNESIKLLVKGFIFGDINLDMDTRGKIFNIINNYWR